MKGFANRLQHVAVIAPEIPFRNRRNRAREPFDNTEGQEIEDGVKFLGEELFLKCFQSVRVGGIGGAPEVMNLRFRSGRAARTDRYRDCLGDGGMFAFTLAKRLLIKDDLHELGMMVRRERAEMTTEELVINESPNVIVPEELALH